MFFPRGMEVRMAQQRKASRHSSAPKKTTRSNIVSPEAASRLAELAQEMRQLLFGGDGVPVWGTKFTEIEAEGMNVGLELARLFMQQSLAGQASGEVPQAALVSDGEVARIGNRTQAATLETPAGEVAWEQPKTRLEAARRDFFPSGEGLGD
jgi:hypothetical protein